MTPHRDERPSAGRPAAAPTMSRATAGRGPEMDGPELIARDLALLATTNPEAFHSALHELTDALATSTHPDAELLALGAELPALSETIRACPGDAELEHADTRLATVEELIATLAPTTGLGLAVKLRLAWAWWVEDAAELRDGPTQASDDKTRLLWRLLPQAEPLAGHRQEEAARG